MVEVLLLPGSVTVIEGVGATVSTVTVVLVPAVLPAASVAVTATVCVPSARVTVPLTGVTGLLSTVTWTVGIVLPSVAVTWTVLTLVTWSLVDV